MSYLVPQDNSMCCYNYKTLITQCAVIIITQCVVIIIAQCAIADTNNWICLTISW